MSKTVFEKIIDREIPAAIEFEDDELIAIRDVAPTAAVHVLIIPKRVIASVNELTDDDAALVGRIHVVAKGLAEKFGIANSGYRVITNTNSDAGQTVPHLHFHLIGGEPLGRMNSHGIGGSSHTASNLPAASAPKMANSLKLSLREAGLMVLMAVGLAIGFNLMNSKSIPWVKKEYERVSASTTDLDKYLGSTDVDVNAAPVDTKQTNTPQSTGVAVHADPKINTTTQPVVQPPTPVVEQAAKPPAFVPEPGVVREINLDQFKKLMSAGNYYLIDARTTESFAKAHIKNAVNFYGGDVQAQIPAMMSSVPRDRVILIYCDGGECELSHHVADVLKQFGYGPMFIFTGGWAEWIKQPK